MPSNPIPAQTILDNFGWRYATKKFDPTKKIPAATWTALEHAAVLSPSSYGLQPWKFIVINDTATRAKLRGASWNQPQITDASHMVVFARKITMTPADVETYIRRIMEVRHAPAEALQGYKDMMVGSITNPPGLPGGSMETWTRAQTYIALGFFLSAAAMLGVDACPMEGFDPKQYDEILGLGKHGVTACVVGTAGYRAADDDNARNAKVRFGDKDVLVRV